MWLRVRLRVIARFVRPQVVDNGDGTYACTYAPPHSGEYRMRVLAAGKAVRGSPFLIAVGAGAVCAHKVSRFP